MAHTYLDFGAALSCLRGEGKAYRKGWAYTGNRIALHYPRVGDTVDRPTIFLFADGIRTPWVPDQEDMFAVDWVIEPKE